MSSSRPKLKLDEQSFQDMLAAAFTIQEHNAKRKPAQPQPNCGRCGAPTKEGEPLCGKCLGEEFRPGEEMQRKWASLWLMSQEQGLWPDRSSDHHDGSGEESAGLGFPYAVEIPCATEETDAIADDEAETEWPGADLSDMRQLVTVPHATPDIESGLEESSDENPALAPWNLRDLRLKLRFHRADLYLVVAIIVSTLAMVWVLSATPPGPQRKPRLRPLERALVSLGLAEAPEPPVRRGNPNAQVWVDPKTALYYCAGEEQYGKTPGGHTATQREAQLDQFEPAGRAACE